MVIHITDRPSGLLNKIAMLSLFIGILLLVIKFTAYALTGSAAILSDAAESIVNVVTAGFALFSLKIAMQPADEKHPYGHGKIEFFSAALEGGAIIVAAIWIIYKASAELITGSHIHQLDTGILLVAFAAGVNLLLGWYMIKIGKRERSLILEADGHHVMTDVVTSIAVVVGLVIVFFTRWVVLDSIIAILAALNILFSGYKLLKRAAQGMMDESSDEDKEAILKIMKELSFPDVCEYHKIRHRLSGSLHFVDFHLIVRRGLPIEQAHAIATAIEAQIADNLGDASVMAHLEPCKKIDCPNCKKFETLINL